MGDSDVNGLDVLLEALLLQKRVRKGRRKGEGREGRMCEQVEKGIDE